MSGFRFAKMPGFPNFKAFRRIAITDDLGYRSEIFVPNDISPAQVRASCLQLQHFITMHAGAFAEVTYQAYLGCVDWFKFHRADQQDATTADFFSRMKNVLRQATAYHQRLADKDFIEAYFGCVVGDQSQSIEHIRSACYDVFKHAHDPATALDMAFVAQIYVCACYQVSVCNACIRNEFKRSRIQWEQSFRRFYLDDIASYADRLLREKYDIDVAAVNDEISKVAEYVFEDMTRSAFDPERIERNIRAAYAEMTPEAREKYGPVETQLARFPLLDKRLEKK